MVDNNSEVITPRFNGPQTIGKQDLGVTGDVPSHVPERQLMEDIKATVKSAANNFKESQDATDVDAIRKAGEEHRGNSQE